jgi:hypothetical protein
MPQTYRLINSKLLQIPNNQLIILYFEKLFKINLIVK